ncbi:hypothetical protein B296_00041201, partial [Ensete ventricosum]
MAYEGSEEGGRPAPMQGRPPMAKPPARGRPVAARASPQGRPAPLAGIAARRGGTCGHDRAGVRKGG